MLRTRQVCDICSEYGMYIIASYVESLRGHTIYWCKRCGSLSKKSECSREPAITTWSSTSLCDKYHNKECKDIEITDVGV